MAPLRLPGGFAGLMALPQPMRITPRMAVPAEAATACTSSYSANNITIAVFFIIYFILCASVAALVTHICVTPKLSQGQSQRRWMLSIGITPAMTVIFLFATPFVVAQIFLQLVVWAVLDVCYSSVEEKLEHGIMQLYYKDSPEITIDELIERYRQQEEEMNNRMVVQRGELLEPHQQRQQQPESNRMVVRLSKRFLELPPLCYVPPCMRRPILSYLAPDKMAFVDLLVILRKQIRNGTTSATEGPKLAARQGWEPVCQSNGWRISTYYRQLRKFHRGELAPLLPRDDTAANDNH